VLETSVVLALCCVLLLVRKLRLLRGKSLLRFAKYCNLDLFICLQANSDADEVDLFLIVTLIKYICGEPPYSREEEGGLILGAVLVFLPGANLT